MSGSDVDYDVLEEREQAEMYIDELEETISKLEERIRELENA